jgi:sulfonate dioxygenase
LQEENWNVQDAGQTLRGTPAHPVTKQKILSIHQAHARRIFGYKKEESEYLFNFLNDVLVKGGDFQTRAHYEPGTVVVWDK